MTSRVVQFMRRHRITLSWCISVPALFLALLPLLHAGLIDDDLVILLGGVADSWSQEPLLNVLGRHIVDHVDGTHVAPVAGILTTLYTEAAILLASSPLNLSTAWGLLRILLAVSGVLSTALLLASGLQAFRLTSRSLRTLLPICFSISGAVFAATFQIHALWSNDPIISYPIAGWGTVILGFLMVTALLRATLTSGKQRVLFIVLGSLAGVAAVLNYELAIALIPGLYVLAFTLPLLTLRAGRRLQATLQLLIIPTAASILFVITQIWRLAQPNDYTGTQSGHSAWILPVLKNSMLSTLPLTVGDRVRESVSESSGTLPTVIVTNLALLLMTFAAILVVGWRFRIIDRLVSRRSWVGALILAVIFPASASLFAGLIFSTSSKYQVEISTRLGNVYIYYVLAACCLVSTTVALFFILQSRFTRIAWGILLMVIVPLGVIQTGWNANSANQLQLDSTWSTKLLIALESDEDESARCQALDLKVVEQLPRWYYNTMVNGLQDSYISRTGVPFCNRPQFMNLSRNLKPY